MKKFLIAILAFAFITPIVSKAQTPNGIALTAMKSATGYTKDTVTSTTAHYLISPVKLTGINALTVEAYALEISGTTSGTLRLEASIDSITWYPYYPGQPTNTTGVDSVNSNLRLTLQDITTKQAYRWYIPEFSDQYFRVACVGGGSTNWACAAAFIARKRPY